ncbi:tRNA (N(6)-L-threonylcarbamoyladenosine(37)-C(2))-methylthiotransferase MtaB [Candidatus Puniceispirillum sp.]|nr:tRNA (N(6)-L-threonylcarbamoyladenosine(37)-C(2))-methylthiotransferase MtaB [Candidatus Puniceispirillum sp.]
MTKRNTPRVQTFGCRLNIWESEVLRAQAGAAGLSDAIIFNTCAVTAEAEKQARQAIRKARRDHPDTRIIVTGCAAQIAPDLWADMPEVTQVLGNHDKLKAESWEKLAAIDGSTLLVSNIMEVHETASHLVDSFHKHTRAFLQVQQGCDHRCTFCIIPYGRGNNRSVPKSGLVDAAKNLVANGCKEVVLTGVDITSWGNDLPSRPRLGNLVRHLLEEVKDLPRLRLSSIDPAELDAELMDVLADDPRLMPHLHLSAQHGDDIILKRMKRRHLARDIMRFCDEARRRRSDVVFGADVIAGFPTETDQGHQASLDMIVAANITHLHVFPYSPRVGTPAAEMPQLKPEIIKTRSRALRLLGAQQLEGFLDSALGTKDQLLVEKGNCGHGRNFTKIRLDGEICPSGRLVDVDIVRRDGDSLVGRKRARGT